MASFHKFLRAEINDVETINAVGDYSAEPQIFSYNAPGGSVVEIKRLLITLAAPVIAWATYGGRTILENGIIVRVNDDDGNIQDLTDGSPVNQSAGWGVHAHNVELKDTGNASQLDFISASWEFEELTLRGDSGQRLEVIFNDDFTGLTLHHFKVDGRIT